MHQYTTECLAANQDCSSSIFDYTSNNAINYFKRVNTALCIALVNNKDAKIIIGTKYENKKVVCGNDILIVRLQLDKITYQFHMPKNAFMVDSRRIFNMMTVFTPIGSKLATPKETYDFLYYNEIQKDF